MKNKIFISLKFVLIFFLFTYSLAEELQINSSEVKLDKKKSELLLKGNIKAQDEKNNILFAEEANYDKKKDFLQSKGETKIITSQNYIINSKNVKFDNKKKVIESNFPTLIIDPDGNEISVEMFNYNSIENILFSRGNISLKDKNTNVFRFSEIYIDQNKRKIIGSDAKLFFNDKNFKADPRNEPRLFANSIAIEKEETSVQKGVITFCKYRAEEKCPPWELQAKKIKHNSTKKTIYYDSATLKIYDFPIFYFPILSHPDPSVKRRSGFLVPSFSDSTNIGLGVNIPYFWDIANDKDITFTPRLYSNNKPLFLTEYRQDFEKSFFILDTGYSDGYKKTSNSKTKGSRSHIFAKFFNSFFEEENLSSNLEVNLQHVSNNTYPRINKIDTSLVDYLDSTVKNTVEYSYQKEDLFFNTSFFAFEDLSKTGNDRYEYIYPETTLEKNVFVSEEFGLVDFKSELSVRNFQVDKHLDVVTNQFSWSSNSWISKFGFENEFLGLFKNVNYKAKNTNYYKLNDTISEFYGALGFKSELGLFQIFDNDKLHVFKPKFLLRLSPHDSRDISENANVSSLKYSNVFNLNRVNSLDKIDTGNSLSLGFDFKISDIDKNKSITKDIFKFSLGQIINEKSNIHMPKKASLGQRFSDIAGETTLNVNDNLTISNNFLLDQNLEDINKNEFSIDFIYPSVNFNLGYLEENEHVGDQKYLQSKFGINLNNSLISFGAKRNLLTHSAEFYNLSYEYINDCLKAGLAFRREFYRDRDLEPEDSLFFKITFSPLGAIETPSLSE